MSQETVYFVQIFDKPSGRPISGRVPCRVIVNDDKTFTILEPLDLQAAEDSDDPILRWFAFESAVFYSHQTPLIQKLFSLEEIVASKPNRLH